MLSIRLALVAPAVLLASAAVPASEPVDPLRFFEGQTEAQGIVKVVLRKPYRSRTSGVGHIGQDGSLTLVQRVQDEGQAPRQRRWNVRAAGPGHFTASMSEAVGPVLIDQIGDRYRFRFKLKGNLVAEQILTPLAGGRAARNTVKIRKMGMVVATTEGTIRKIG